MKRVIAAVFFLSAALAIGLLSLKAINTSCDELSAAFEEIKKAAVEKNSAALKEKNENINNVWEEKEVFFHILVDHSEIADLEKDIGRLDYYAKTEDFKNVLTLAEACRDDTAHIKRSASPAISNIF